MRRVVLAPLVIALALVLLATSPAWVLLTLAASPLVPGRLRPLRLLWLTTCYLLVEAVALVVMFALWLASGLGWKVRGPLFQRLHYRLCGRLLRVEAVGSPEAWRENADQECGDDEVLRDRHDLEW